MGKNTPLLNIAFFKRRKRQITTQGLLQEKTALEILKFINDLPNKTVTYDRNHTNKEKFVLIWSLFKACVPLSEFVRANRKQQQLDWLATNTDEHHQSLVFNPIHVLQGFVAVKKAEKSGKRA
jgi:hypothetical protein